MMGKFLCAVGLHRVVTTREGKAKGSAASFIHVFCYREGCSFHEVIDTHTGRKDVIHRESAAKSGHPA